MKLKIKSNKLYNKKQEIQIPNHLLTLIGENGCGKSSILEAIFEKYLNSEKYRTIGFSSGQNELFTQLFNKHKAENKRYLHTEEDRYIESFYFNYDWVRVLIFFATILKPNGNVRKYLVSRGYVQLDVMKDDLSSKLIFPFRVRKYYPIKISKEIEMESSSYFDKDVKLFRKSHFHDTLSKIISTFKIKYDIEDGESGPLVKRKLTLNNDSTFRIFTDKDINRIFTFWALATYGYQRNVDLQDCKLYFNNNIELRSLSDGEYQILSIYAMIDLFDNENTVFLLDEIDSHLYYENLSRLWKILQTKVKGKIITTTHISESILKNDFDNIRLVKRGKIELELTLRDLAKRLASVVGNTKYEYQLATRIKNIVLIDHEDDWVIFKKLAQKKIKENVNEVFKQIIPLQRTSGFNNNDDLFGKWKLLFVKDFKDKLNGAVIETKRFFLICDRDKLSKSSIDKELQVRIHNDFKEVKKFNGVSTHLLSWNRLEIENYLLSITMLENKGKLQDLKDKFPHLVLTKKNNLDNIADIEEYDAKGLLHPLYKESGFEESALDELISLIPKKEISEDIVKMYNYLKNKIAN